MAQIEILEGPNAGRTYEIEGARAVVGRGRECDICLDDASISRQHAAFEQEDGAWHLKDLESQNGCFVDGERVRHLALPEPLSIHLGTVLIRFDGRGGAGGSPLAAPEPTQNVATPAGGAAAGATSPDDAAVKGIREMARIYPAIETEFGRVIIGQRGVLEELLVAIAAGGHCLMIGLPGLAKTLMVSTLANVLRLTFKRIQFTPDLMPSDIIGTDVLDIEESSGQKHFRFIKGPIFTNMLLADEINRTPPKTQSALLESMQERQVTVANHVFPLPPPFFVLATQNPLEQEGTYPLPEAQLDRFMFNILVDYPAEQEEETIVETTTGEQNVTLRQILSAEDLLALQERVRGLPVSRHVVRYATRLVRMSRPKTEGAPQFIKDNVYCGAGPRAAQYLILGAKARAVIHGRVNVGCDDVRALALPVMRHRLFTNFTADSEGVTPDDLVKQLLVSVPEPDQTEY